MSKIQEQKYSAQFSLPRVAQEGEEGEGGCGGRGKPLKKNKNSKQCRLSILKCGEEFGYKYLCVR
jgi:hypothetical protein